MARKYQPMLVPMVAYKDLKEKQRKMQEVFKQLTKKNVKIPMTNILCVMAKQPFNLGDKALLRMHKRGKKV